MLNTSIRVLSVICNVAIATFCLLDARQEIGKLVKK